MKRKLYTLLIVNITFLFAFLAQPISASFSNEPIHWGFKKSQNHEPPYPGKKLDQLLKKYDGFYLGNTDEKKKHIYLTFDNGYEHGHTADILNVLKEKEVPATFFVTGHYLEKNEALIKRMVNEGHIVGNHSWHHPDFTKVSDTRLKKELKLVKDKFEEITGVNGMSYLRPPRGIFSERTLALSKEEGYINVMWSLAFVDWKTDDQKGWKYAYDNIMKQIHPGAVILLHAVSKDNAEALGKAIDDLRKKGYTFKSLDDLMAEKVVPNPIIFP